MHRGGGAGAQLVFGTSSAPFWSVYTTYHPLYLNKYMARRASPLFLVHCVRCVSTTGAIQKESKPNLDLVHSTPNIVSNDADLEHIL